MNSSLIDSSFHYFFFYSVQDCSVEIIFTRGLGRSLRKSLPWEGNGYLLEINIAETRLEQSPYRFKV